MNRGKRIVEQVNSQGEILKDLDYWLHWSELFAVIKENFPNVEKCSGRSTYIKCERESEKYLIRVKNITYLGKPHKLYKKRYQIPKDLSEFYAYALENGFVPLMIGVYTYGDLTLFVDFSIESYIDNKHNNSSAHVYSTDLQQVFLYDESELEEEEEPSRYGYFEKVDMNGNRVSIFDKESVDYYLDTRKNDENVILDKLKELKNAVEQKEECFIDGEGKVEIERRYAEERIKEYGKKLLPDKTRNIILNYFASIKKEWHGKECYDLMIKGNYPNKNQAEWPGFFLEYSFEKYLIENAYIDTVYYAQEKVAGGVDLDLYLEEVQTYADLKAHSEGKKDIPGNKAETVESVLKENGQIFYIVCEHTTEMDLDHSLEVTEYWNSHKTNRKPNQNPHSYQKRMKNSVVLKKVNILSINASNVSYLKGFTQGKNSNGKPRKVKIMIDGDHLSEFLKISYEL